MMLWNSYSIAIVAYEPFASLLKTKDRSCRGKYNPGWAFQNILKHTVKQCKHVFNECSWDIGVPNKGMSSTKMEYANGRYL